MTWITETSVIADWITLNWVKENNLTTDLNWLLLLKKEKDATYFGQTIMSQRRLNIVVFSI